MDDYCKVKVRAGWSKIHECPTIEFIIYVKDVTDEHYHVVIDENGRELISKWRKNKGH